MNAEIEARIYYDALLDCAYGDLVDKVNEQHDKVGRLRSELAAALNGLSRLHEAREEMVCLDDDEEPYEPVHLRLVRDDDEKGSQRQTTSLNDQIEKLQLESLRVYRETMGLPHCTGRGS